MGAPWAYTPGRLPAPDNAAEYLLSTYGLGQPVVVPTIAYQAWYTRFRGIRVSVVYAFPWSPSSGTDLEFTSHALQICMACTSSRWGLVYSIHTLCTVSDIVMKIEASSVSNSCLV
jgi:hypothetical protein